MGFFKVDRQLFNHWLWEDRPFSKGQAWIDLIGLANYEDNKTLYRSQMFECKRGTVNRSISFLARRWGWSRDKTRHFLVLLEQDNMIRVKATTNHTTIILENYGKYQDLPTTNSSTNRQQTRQQTDSEPGKEKRNKEYKEVKNIFMAQPDTAPSFSPPSISEVTAYVRQMGYGVDPEKFVAYYEARDWTLSRGQSMKDWKASVRYWEANKQEKTPGISNEVKVTIDDELDREIYGDKWS